MKKKLFYLTELKKETQQSNKCVDIVIRINTILKSNIYKWDVPI